MASDTDNSSATNLGDSEIIERFGGIRPMAGKLGVAVTTVQGWKVRGHIPPGRRAEILAMAEKLGIDVGATTAAAQEPPAASEAVPGPARMPDPESEPRPEQRPAAKASVSPAGKPDRAPMEKPAPAPPTRSGVAWLALAVAVLAGAAMLSQPWWAPRLYPAGPAPAGNGQAAAAAEEVRELSEQVSRLSANLADRLDKLDSRLAVLEENSGVADLGPQFEALDRGLGSLASGLESISAGLSGLEARIAVLESAPQVPKSVETALGEHSAELDSLTDSLTESLASLRGELARIGERIVEIESRPVQTGEKIAVTVLAIGQVEAAFNAGRPYRGALNRLEVLARDDPLILESDAIAVLSPWADRGIPSRAALLRRFGEITPDMVRAQAESGGDSWLDRVWNSVSTVVTVRRTEGTSEELPPVSRAEAALARDDLAGAVAALRNAGPLGAEGQAWYSNAENRLRGEAEIKKLYGRILEPLRGALGNGGQ